MDALLQALNQYLAPHYMSIKFVHLLAAMVWLWSTSVAFVSFLVPTMRRWQEQPDNPQRIASRNWVMECFDDGVRLEHLAFPLLLITGVTLLLIGGWTAQSHWLVLKLCIVTLVFLPMETADYWLSHFGGNKRGIRLRELRGEVTALDYEQAILRHWWFLIVTTPVVSVSGLVVVWLAVTKPF